MPSAADKAPVIDESIKIKGQKGLENLGRISIDTASTQDAHCPYEEELKIFLTHPPAALLENIGTQRLPKRFSKRKSLVMSHYRQRGPKERMEALHEESTHEFMESIEDMTSIERSIPTSPFEVVKDVPVLCDKKRENLQRMKAQDGCTTAHDPAGIMSPAQSQKKTCNISEDNISGDNYSHLQSSLDSEMRPHDMQQVQQVSPKSLIREYRLAGASDSKLHTADSDARGAGTRPALVLENEPFDERWEFFEPSFDAQGLFTAELKKPVMASSRSESYEAGRARESKEPIHKLFGGTDSFLCGMLPDRTQEEGGASTQNKSPMSVVDFDPKDQSKSVFSGAEFSFLDAQESHHMFVDDEAEAGQTVLYDTSLEQSFLSEDDAYGFLEDGTLCQNRYGEI
jgi:hypothetical protein